MPTPCDKLPSEAAFRKYGNDGDFKEHERVYHSLRQRIVQSLSASTPEVWGEPHQVRDYGTIYQQVLLHRSVWLYYGAHLCAADENVYSAALSVRGHFETTTALGYFHHRLNSLLDGNLTAEKVHEDLVTLILGTRLETIAHAPPAKQVMDMLEFADKAVSKHVLGGASKQHDMLTDSYKFLCEFCHPNYHSNSLAFSLDKERGTFTFRHGGALRPEEFGLVDYLLLSGPIFADLLDMSSVLLERIGLSATPSQ